MSSLQGMSIRQAYKKAGVKWEDVDFMSMGIDNESLAKKMVVRPRKGLISGKQVPVGPKDLLRALGYSEYGHLLPVQKWTPGEKHYDFPQWVKPDGKEAPLCSYAIPFVCPTGNEVTPYVGCEKFDDLGPTIRFYLPYVYLESTEQWYRLTGGTDKEIGVMGVRHFALILRMGYEEGSLKADGEWRRHYPITAHNQLEQLYYRGLELHAPAATVYYKKGKSFNDVQYFDARKDEFSAEEMDKKKRLETRDKMRQEMAAKAREVEKQNMLEELAKEAEMEDMKMKRKLKDKSREAEDKRLDEMEATRLKEEKDNKMKGQAMMQAMKDL
mmetsp:Transcript_20910/g.52510  ORF Transcript_20910/g.52510 Transcript_20910/m.52510 type:complete len:327 (+) Transcript_20910:125-1105(+)|eukprot:CAMPEP_0173452494 /NCGR_PEP_ID=MMETSP1357-20121228/48823_1 /TAXON_ID=77926 /ORGANISM="Hemiselmis rufescens, Strain PCC563" /LENGTH=326 /DNA_ID=CAMNT_0014419375 /DNA_START=95 /DNA_END=1075 /DNA_ORIENTATION=-